MGDSRATENLFLPSSLEAQLSLTLLLEKAELITLENLHCWKINSKVRICTPELAQSLVIVLKAESTCTSYEFYKLLNLNKLKKKNIQCRLFDLVLRHFDLIRKQTIQCTLYSCYPNL